MNASLVILVLLVAIAGCGSSESPPAGQQTPRDTLRKLHDALLTRDKDAFLSCYENTPAMRAVALSSFDYTVSAHELFRAIEFRYGEGAAAEFNAAKPEGMATFNAAIPPLDPTWPDQAEIKRTTTAVAEVWVELDNGKRLSWPMQKMGDGAWYLSSQVLAGKYSDDKVVCNVGRVVSKNPQGFEER